uniref:Uncharacterized protein n=1 Tax=Glossina austeni TaxID=7395 RepID=A0A1A9UEU6_GLOAU
MNVTFWWNKETVDTKLALPNDIRHTFNNAGLETIITHLNKRRSSSYLAKTVGNSDCRRSNPIGFESGLIFAIPLSSVTSVGVHTLAVGSLSRSIVRCPSEKVLSQVTALPGMGGTNSVSVSKSSGNVVSSFGVVFSETWLKPAALDTEGHQG